MYMQVVVLSILFIQQCYSELIHLGLKNYTMSKKEYQPLVVFYYGNDKVSKKFIDEFTLIATHSHSIQASSTFPNNINFGLVDTITESKLMEKTQIVSTPTIILFYDDEQKLKYNGAYNAQSFINWIKKTVRDSPSLNEFYPSSLISRWEQLQNKFKGFQLIAILITPEFRLSPLKAFVSAAKQMSQGFVYCHIHDYDLYRHLKVDKEDSQLIIYSKNEDIEKVSEADSNKWSTYLYRYKGDVKNEDEILKYLKIHSFRKGFVYVDDTKFQKLSRRQDLLPSILLLYNKTSEEHQSYVDKMQESRYSLLNKAIVGIINVDNDCADRLDRWFEIDVNNTKVPQLIAIKPINDNQFYKYKSRTLDPLEFYEQIQQGTVRPFYKDEGIITNLYDGAGIYKLTRTTYDTYIKEQNQKGIDVVVMYTAKKCQPCIEFRPDYNEVYKTYKSKMEGKMQFTRVDIELNEIDNLFIDSYPHVKLYAAGQENSYTLQRDKTEEGLKQWLKENTNYPEIFAENSDL